MSRYPQDTVETRPPQPMDRPNGGSQIAANDEANNEKMRRDLAERGYGRPVTLEDRLRHLFTYHAPKSELQLKQYETIRDAALGFAQVIVKNTSPGADQSDAIRKLRECVMTANASIALDGLGF